MKTVLDAEDKNITANFLDWNEYYVSNILFQRICNYRVVDATIYHADRLGYGNEKMQEDFFYQTICVFPQPIVNTFFDKMDKSHYMTHSPMDKLYTLSTGIPMKSFIVGGDVGLGLATFGIIYFLIQIAVYFLLFYFMNNLIYIKCGRVIFSTFVLIQIMKYCFIRLDVGAGISGHIQFFLYSAYINIILYIIIVKFVRIVSKMRI